MAITVELKGFYVVFCTHSPCNSQALASLHVFDPKNAAYVDYAPTARGMTVAVELQGLSLIHI